jgi:Fe2+ or Zn2+ uptake regulation protein
MAVTEYLRQTKGTVSQTLKVLEKKGLLSKHADSRDKRVTHLKLSSNGKELIQNTIPSPLFVDACEQLDESSQVKIVDALKTLLQTIQHTNGMKSFGVCINCQYNQQTDTGYFCNLTKEPLSDKDIQLICREYIKAT